MVATERAPPVGRPQLAVAVNCDPPEAGLSLERQFGAAMAVGEDEGGVGMDERVVDVREGV